MCKQRDEAGDGSPGRPLHRGPADWGSHAQPAACVGRCSLPGRWPHLFASLWQVSSYDGQSRAVGTEAGGPKSCKCFLSGPFQKGVPPAPPRGSQLLERRVQGSHPPSSSFNFPTASLRSPRLLRHCGPPPRSPAHLCIPGPSWGIQQPHGHLSAPSMRRGLGWRLAPGLSSSRTNCKAQAEPWGPSSPFSPGPSNPAGRGQGRWRQRVRKHPELGVTWDGSVKAFLLPPLGALTLTRSCSASKPPPTGPFQALPAPHLRGSAPCLPSPQRPTSLLQALHMLRSPPASPPHPDPSFRSTGLHFSGDTSLPPRPGQGPLTPILPPRPGVLIPLLQSSLGGQLLAQRLFSAWNGSAISATSPVPGTEPARAEVQLTFVE